MSSMEDLRTHLAQFVPDYPLKKGYVAQLLMTRSRPTLTDAVKNVKAVLVAKDIEMDKCIDEVALKNNVARLDKVLRQKITSMRGQWLSIVALCQEIFPVKFKTVSNSLLLQPVTSISDELQSISGTSVRSPSPKKLRCSCQCESCVNTRRTFANMKKKSTSLQRKITEIRKKHRERLEGKSVKRLNETIKRKAATIDLLKKKYKESCVRKYEVDELRNFLQVAREKGDNLAAIVREHKSTVKILQKQLQKANKKISKLAIEKEEDRRRHKKEMLLARRERHNDCSFFANELAILQEERTESSNIVEVKSNKKQYGLAIRKCIYFCLLSQVGVTQCTDVVSYMCKYMLGKQLSDTPTDTVVAQMAYEIGVLSDIQTGYLLHRSRVINMAWDGTTFKGVYVDELHLNICMESDSNIKSLVLSIDALAGGTTEDYLQHITNALLDLVRTYSDCYGLSDTTVKQDIFSKIKSCITDRAAVNHCVIERLKEEFDMDLVELKCHVHPLDGLAVSARSTLHMLDTEWGLLSPETRCSTGCLAAELIHNISKMRYKQGTGDPVGLVTFLREKKLQPGIILRYVGNRIHVLFHMAAIIYTLRVELLDFFESKCNRKGAVKSAIVKQLNNSIVLAQLQALGLFSKILTGPWMRVFYKNELQRSNLELVSDGVFKQCLTFLEKVKNDPSTILSCTHDAFGVALDLDEPVSKLRNIDPSVGVKFNKIVADLADAFIRKLSHQLKPHLSGSLSDPTAAVQAAAAACPSHNMQAERILGMMDALWRRAPNANLGFIDGKVKGIQNGTLHWLDKFPVREQSRLVAFAVRRGAKVKHMRKQRERATEKARAKKQSAIASKRDMANRNKLEGDIKTALAQQLPLADVEMFKGFSKVDLDKLEKLVKCDESLIGNYLLHVWDENGSDVSYMERVTSFWTKKVATAKPHVNYVCLTGWKKNDEPPSEAEYEMTIHKLLIDFALGDVRFL